MSDSTEKLCTRVLEETERANRAERERDEARQQAQVHAQEARTQAATVREIYQLCTGAAGEPGTWHGAEPVRRLIAERDAALERERQKDRQIADLRDALEALALVMVRDDLIWWQNDPVAAQARAALAKANQSEPTEGTQEGSHDD